MIYKSLWIKATAFAIFAALALPTLALPQLAVCAPTTCGEKGICTIYKGKAYCSSNQSQVTRVEDPSTGNLFNVCPQSDSNPSNSSLVLKDASGRHYGVGKDGHMCVWPISVKNFTVVAEVL
jgi:hypothetical protein